VRRESTRVMRASGAAGVLAAILILGGLYLAAMGASGGPGSNADAAAWAAWAEREENPIEIGVYLVLFPGLLLFLWMFAALSGLLPADAISTRLAGFGAISFFVLLSAAGVLASTSASTFGFYNAFDDPTAVTVFTGVTAGYHLQTVGVGALAMTMVAAAVGLRETLAISSRWYFGSIVLAALAFAASLVGFGILPSVVWILAVGVGLLRWAPPSAV
jgi:hypothetical protein